MKKVTAFLFGLLLATASGAATFNIFGPATGILKGTATSPITTAAAWSDVQVLLSGTCNSSVFVRADGSCVAVNLATNVTGTLPAANGGTGVTSLGDLTRTNDTNVTLTLGGTPTGALINSASITAGWTGTLAAARGGLGMSTVTDDTVPVANGTAWQSKTLPTCADTGGNHLNYDTSTNAFSCGTSGSVSGSSLTKTDDTNVTLTLGGSPTTALVNAASITAGWTGTLAASRGGLGMSTVTDDTVAVANGTTWQSKAIPSCADSSGNHLNYDTSSNAFSCGTSSSVAAPTAANPSASVGLSAVNGSASTFMRSDAAPALSQSISPTWTGNHTFSGSGDAVIVNGASGHYAFQINSSTSAGNGYGAAFTAGTSSADNAFLVRASATGNRSYLLIRGDGLTQFGNTTDNPAVTFLGTGAATFGGVLLGPNGSGAAPTYSFSNETDMGWERAAANDMRGTVNGGTSGLQITATTVRPFGVVVTADNGSAAAPVYSFDGDPDTGMYTTGAGVVAFAGNSNLGAAIAGGSAAPFRAYAADTVGDNYWIYYDSAGSEKGYVGFGNSSDDNFTLMNEKNASLGIGTNNAVRMTFDTSGGIYTNGATGSGQGSGTINATGVYVNGVSVVGGAVTTGTFSATLTGMTGTVTCSMKWRLTGSRVDLFLNSGSACTGTSNATTMTMTGLPAAIQPSATAWLPCLGVDSSATAFSSCFIDTSTSASTIRFDRTNNSGTVTNFSSAGWTNTGTKGIPIGWDVTYDLRN